MFDPSEIPNVWRAQSLVASTSFVPTGFDALDAALGGGWPASALIEILTDTYGIGEVQLLVPLLRHLVQSAPQPVLILWSNPPYEPNAVALAQHGLVACQHWLVRNTSARDTLWCTEQALRSGACSAALAWLPSATTNHLRRLKLAVNATATYAILFRPHAEGNQPSPAHVRLQLSTRQGQLHVVVIKAQGRQRCELLLDVDAMRLQRKEPLR